MHNNAVNYFSILDTFVAQQKKKSTKIYEYIEQTKRSTI